MIAAHFGICPVCCHYIAKNRSDIERLPKPLRPQVEQSDRFYFECVSWRHNAGNEAGEPLDMTPRAWAHRACMPTGERCTCYRCGTLHNAQPGTLYCPSCAVQKP